MNGSLKVVQGIVLLSFVGLMFSSCGGSQTTLSSTDATSGTTTVDPTPAASEPTVEEEEQQATIPSGYSASNLFVTVPDTIDYLNFTSVTGDWASRCTFTTASVVNDLTCNFEVNELAIFKDGIKFQYNVPANQCKYIATYPYWYWNYEVGIGPRDVQVTVNRNASGTVTSSQCVVDGSDPYTCTSTTPPTAGSDVEFDISDEIKVQCSYDTSTVDGGQNCCFGKYRLRTTENTPDGSTSTDERGKEWGGSVESCIGGPGRTSWEQKTSKGYPRYVIENMTPNKARTKLVIVEPTIDHAPGSGSNIPIANYFSMGQHNHTGYGATSGVVTSVYPYYVDPISDRSGDLIDSIGSTVLSPGSPYYIFDCLDEAFEVNYRIRVMVQEWDTVAALTSYISSGVSTPVGADEPGSAPADCPGQSGEACNQLTDADNFVDSSPNGNYGNGVPANRVRNFPRHVYE